MKKAAVLVAVLVLAGCGGKSEYDREVAAIRGLLTEAESAAAEVKAAYKPGEDAAYDDPCVSSNPNNLAAQTIDELDEFKHFIVREVTDDMSDELEAFQWCVASVELGETLDAAR